jgi:2-keto-4-pentenoate hydratase/2-oxohepta-3-ene-1,7-dioic acid hydratase in catechol pathway
LRIATYWWGGRRHVGRLSGDEKTVVPLALGERAHAVGALALIEAMARGTRAPQPAGASLPLAAIRRDAPIPVPRRNIFGLEPPRHLKRGDVVRIEIDGIGVLENPVH